MAGRTMLKTKKADAAKALRKVVLLENSDRGEDAHSYTQRAVESFL